MKPPRKNVLILSFSEIGRDPRVYRQIVFLKDSCTLTVAGLGHLLERGVEFCRIANRMRRDVSEVFLSILRLKTERFDQYYWSSLTVKSALQMLKDRQFQLIIANDLDTLPLALQLSARCRAKVLLDAHEFEPRHFDDRWRFRFFYQEYWDYICRTYLPRVAAMVTVSPGIAEEYTRCYGVSCGVITNAAFYEARLPRRVSPENIRMVHHGALNPSRKLEHMILLMDLLQERFSLDLMLLPNDRRCLHRLQRLSRNRPRVNFRSPVPMNEITGVLSQYDVGLFLLWPGAFSYRMALPNKLFEFIQGRLAIAIWPSPEMARVVRESSCGVVAKDFTIESMAEAINGLSTEDIWRLKKHSHRAAPRLSAQNNRQLMVDLVHRLIE